MSLSALQTVLGFDLEARVLSRRVEELKTAVARAAAEPPPSDALPEDERAKAVKTNEKVAARLAKRLADAESLLAEIATDTAETRAASILSGLQFSRGMMEAPLSTLSGGWRMRATLAAALFVPCDILLLDEPTNHLDFPAVDWLTRWEMRCTGRAPSPPAHPHLRLSFRRSISSPCLSLCPFTLPGGCNRVPPPPSSSRTTVASSTR